jgi:hypothetical protein
MRELNRAERDGGGNEPTQRHVQTIAATVQPLLFLHFQTP